MKNNIFLRTDIKASRGKISASFHLIGGYSRSLSDYMELVRKLRKNFPKAADSKISFHQITKSNSMKGFILVTYNTEVPKGFRLKRWRVIELTGDDNPPYRFN